MAITFHPRPGTLLMCDFTGFKPPEMVKKRPVVVVSRSHRQLATVVPLSTVAPCPFEPCHVEMCVGSMPKSLQSQRCWAKCDRVTCVAFCRLDRIMDGKDPKTGRRLYVSPPIEAVDLDQIRQALRHVMGL
jgi:mRNA interferase MazF